jgi:molybdopterin converting factor small subunit
MVTIRILFFGATADAAGARRIDREFPADASAGAALDGIVAEIPALRAHSLLFAVNEEYADRARTLANGDELAIFTPVSGG